jgi:propanol-preferring alcohol dehydrogenase
MSTYRAFQVTGRRQFELVERELLGPQPGHVRFRVQSCGVCHSDVLAVEGLRPDPRQPVVPGHEIVGVIDAVGEQVSGWSVGDRVGVGFLGGHCCACVWCRRGDFVNCENQPRPGTDADGGYAEVVYARETGLVRIPDALASLDASPLLCAGITTYNALQKLQAEPDALVAVQGIGGLGHLGVQYANKLGYRVAAIARGTDKAVLAEKLGAHHYIDSAAVDLVLASRSIVGSLTGSASENEANLRFSAAHGVAPMTEVLPFEEAPAAYERMMSGQARFRVVLDMQTQ